MSKQRIWQVALVMLLAGFSAACGAARPYQYYVLDVNPPAPAAPQAQPEYPVKLIVGRVSTPELYRDSRIVYGTGDVQLGAYEYHRWAELPPEMLQQALISSLRATGQYRSVSAISSTNRGDYILRSQLFSLEGVDKPSLVARFSMEVDLFNTKSGETVWSDRYSHDEPVDGKTVANVVEAMDRDVRAGMTQFTTNLGQYFAAHPPQTQN
ncbi:MAG TPA: ABC-type transport auxiliary lipoprotein family protein [Candidatus Baltobacteraceae bacterium]|nr:ABC-type transport auxiliary lipoprotein family protein [Candidatus Baltobacteraceae bacterium]